MPLRDHFRSPLKDRPPWESINFMWTAGLARWLNRTLPKDIYQARAEVHLGSAIEADVAEYEWLALSGLHHDPTAGGVATLPRVEAPIATVAVEYPTVRTVHLVDKTSADRLVGVIELVSPANKKQTTAREAFLAKCLTYLQRGVGLVVIDLVTDRRTNFHNELVRRVGADHPPAVLPDEPLYVAGYRPIGRADEYVLELWPKAAHVGEPIPTVPLPLKGGPLVALPLEETYLEALSDSNA